MTLTRSAYLAVSEPLLEERKDSLGDEGGFGKRVASFKVACGQCCLVADHYPGVQYYRGHEASGAAARLGAKAAESHPLPAHQRSGKDLSLRSELGHKGRRGTFVVGRNSMGEKEDVGTWWFSLIRVAQGVSSSCKWEAGDLGGRGLFERGLMSRRDADDPDVRGTMRSSRQRGGGLPTPKKGGGERGRVLPGN